MLETTSGVKQKSVLSPVPFIIFMDYFGKFVKQRVNGENFEYTDNLALINNIGESLQSFLNNMG